MEFHLAYKTFLQRLKNQISVLTLHKLNSVPVLLFVDSFRSKANQNLLASLSSVEANDFEPVLVTFEASLERKYRKKGYAVLLLGNMFDSSISTKPDNKLPSAQWPPIFTKFQSRHEVKFEFLKMILIQCMAQKFGSVMFADTRTYWTSNPFPYFRKLIAENDNDILLVNGFQPRNLLQKFNFCVSAKLIYVVKASSELYRFLERLALHILSEKKNSEQAINEFIALDKDHGLKYSAKEFYLTTPGADFIKISSDVMNIQAFGVKIGVLPFMRFPHWYSTQNELVTIKSLDNVFIHTSSVEFPLPPSTEIDELKRLNVWSGYQLTIAEEKKLTRSVKSTLSKEYLNHEQQKARAIRTKQESINLPLIAKLISLNTPKNICLLFSHMNSRALPLAKALGESQMLIGGIPFGLNYYTKADISRFVTISRKNPHLFRNKKWQQSFGLDCLINHDITEDFLIKNPNVRVVLLLRRPSETIDFIPRSLAFGRKLITYEYYIRRMFAMLKIAKNPLFYRRFFFIDSDLLETADQVFFNDLSEFLDLPYSLVDDPKFIEALGSLDSLDEIPNGNTFEGFMATNNDQLASVLSEHERLFDLVVELLMKHCLLPTGYIYESKVLNQRSNDANISSIWDIK